MALRKTLRRNFLTIYLVCMVSMLVMLPFIAYNGSSESMSTFQLFHSPYQHVLLGVDVSRHNDEIEWDKVKNHHFADRPLHFAVIKATEGTDWIDPTFSYNWAEARKHQVIRGAYHFYSPTSDPEVQALNYLSTVFHHPGDLVPILDFENDAPNAFYRKDLGQNVAKWLSIIEEELGVKPIIYTNHKIYNLYIKNQLEDYPIWLADYSIYDALIHNYPNMIMWQLSDGGVVNGIKGKVDLNVFYGTPFKFQKYLFK